MLKKLLGFVVLLLVIFAIVVSMQPSDFKVERSITINREAAAVFEQVNDLHKFQDWSPWAKIDPNTKLIYEGPANGAGSAFSWSSENNEVGKGKMTIIESKLNELVRARLDFVEPMAGTNIADFNIKSADKQTTITWSMSGQKNFIMKAVGLFLDCDKMVGDYFEKGLSQLKSKVETA